MSNKELFERIAKNITSVSDTDLDEAQYLFPAFLDNEDAEEIARSLGVTHDEYERIARSIVAEIDRRQEAWEWDP